MMIVDVVIGNVEETLKEMEVTNCKLPDRLENLQVQWRARKASTNTWKDYYEHIGAPLPAFGSTGEWIADCARRAVAMGPKYVGAKGEGRENGKGSGKGYKNGKGT